MLRVILSVVFNIVVFFRFNGLVRTTIKTDNHILYQEMRRCQFSPLKRQRCQIKSSLLHLMDILMLSRCNYIIKSASAVGEMALWFTDNKNFADLALETGRIKNKWRRRLPAYMTMNVDSLTWRVLRMRALLIRASKFVVKAVPGGEAIKNFSQGRWF